MLVFEGSTTAQVVGDSSLTVDIRVRLHVNPSEIYRNRTVSF